MTPEWIFPTADSAKIRQLSDALGISTLLAQLLITLGLESEDDYRAFLENDTTTLIDPFLFPEMERACERIFRALKDDEKIVVYADYDVDGMTGAVLIYWVLKRLKARCEIFIPDRHKSGYGLNKADLDRLREAGASVVITVDNGVSAGEEIAHAVENGMSVIVTDHHTLPEQLPVGALLLHPQLPGKEYPFRHLCGAGVAFKFGLALLSRSPLEDAEAAIEGFRNNCMDVVALGTVADMVPLIGENRVLVREGLRQLSRSRHPGLKALLGLEGLVGRPLTVDHIAFKLTPKINAAGRIDDYRIAIDLLISSKEDRAGQLALKLNAINHERIRLLKELMALALKEEASWANLSLPVVALKTRHKGVVGLVAQRLKERCRKPVLVLAADEAQATGSGRSIDGFNLLSALREQEEYLERYGGHAMAVGFTIDVEKIPAFQEAIDSSAAMKLSKSPPAAPVQIDAVLDGEDLSSRTLEDLDRLAPFGQGNPAPLLGLRRVPVSRLIKMGDGSHARLESSVFPKGSKTVAFNLADEAQRALDSSSELDLAFHLERDYFRGQESIQIRIRALRPAAG